MSEKATKRLATKLMLPIKYILVRGGTGHRKDLVLQDGTMLHYWPDGEFTVPMPIIPNVGVPSVSAIWAGNWKIKA